MTRADEIVVGMDDYLYAEDESQAVRSIAATVREQLASSPRVVGVPKVRAGGFDLQLEGDLFLECLPTCSDGDPDDELWRLLRPSGPHFVVTVDGVYQQG